MKRRGFLKGLLASALAAPMLAATLRNQVLVLPDEEPSWSSLYGPETNATDWSTASAEEMLADIEAMKADFGDDKGYPQDLWMVSRHEFEWMKKNMNGIGVRRAGGDR